MSILSVSLFISFFLVANCESYAEDDVSASRHLAVEKVIEESNATIIQVKDCLLFYAREILVSQKNGASDVRLPSLKKAGEGSYCGNDSTNSTLVLNWDDEVLPSPLKTFKLSLLFSLMSDPRSWKLASAHASIVCATSSNCTDESQVALTKLDSVGGPSKLSYHCMDVTLRNINITVDFDKFQVQPFFLKNGTFSAASDCIGFFSIGVWSSLFVSFILLAILAFGLVMLADISTMDRFDDPKGKGLQINTSGAD